MAGSRCTQNAVLTDEKLLNTVGSTDLCNLLNDFGVVETAVTANDEERTLDTFGNREEDGGDEGFTVVWLLKDLDLLTQARCARPRDM